MAGEFLPPVVTVLEADISDLIAKVAEAKALIDSLSNSKVEIKVSTTGIAGPVAGAIAQIEALKAAMAGLDNKKINISVDGLGKAAATTAAARGGGGGRGVWWLGGLGLVGIHNIMVVLGAQIFADTAGMIAFGAAAAATLGPVFSGYSTLQTSYATLDPLQKTAALSLNKFLEGFQNANETGVVTVFNEALSIAQGTLQHTGGITAQATQAFMQFGGMLHSQFSSGIWQKVFGGVSGNVSADMTALFSLFSNLIGAIPGLIKDFNGFGLTAIGAVNGVIKAFSFLSENSIGNTILRMTALGLTTYKAFGWLNGKLGLVSKLNSLFGTEAKAGWWGAVAVGVTAVAALGYELSKLPTGAQIAQDALMKQDGTVQTSVSSWRELGKQMADYTKAQQAIVVPINTGKLGAGLNAVKNLNVESGQQLSATDFQNARNLAANYQFLAETYGMTAQQARTLSQATGISLYKAMLSSGQATAQDRFIIQQYVATVRGAAAPTSVLGVQMMLLRQDAGNLTKQGQDLTAMFATLATPFANTISATVTWKQGNTALATALQQSADKVGYATSAQQNSAQALATSITNTEALSSAILQQTGSVNKSFGPIQQEINFLKSLHSHSSLVAQAIKTLQQYIDQLHSKKITLTTVFATSGQSPLSQGFMSGGGGGHVLQTNAAGTPNARPGWSWVGEKGPELIHLKGGEQIIPNHVAAGYAGGAGYPAPSSQPLEVRVFLDGREIQQSVAHHTYQANVDNGSRRRGGRVTGSLAPR